jgi:DNA repair exonuclease SbcCD ATPase subunit
MKFHVNQIHLWLKDGKTRTLDFLPNKVNVITGKSGTGKTSIITIIDYCLLGSEAKLVEADINENVLWYGLKFTVNEKEYVIARGKMLNQIGSDDIYFSSSGVMPKLPHISIGISELRKIIEQEFSVDNNLIIPYGGKKIQAGSKISYRYFLLFNTQSSNVIINENVFFDYDLYDSEKYREALDRIFDLSIGVDSVDNVLIKEKLAQLDKEILKLEKRRKLNEKEHNDFEKKILELISQAQEYDLLEKKLFTIEEGLAKLKALVFEFKEDKISTDISEIEDLYRARRNVGRKIRNMKSFDNEYAKYKENLKADHDSLQPISYIKENFAELIIVPELKSFLEGLQSELQTIKKGIEKKKPFSTDIKKDIEENEKELSVLTKKINEYPIRTKDFEGSVGKFIFIGELRTNLAFYSREWEDENFDHQISTLTQEQEELKKKITDNDERKAIMMLLLQERVQNYISNCTAIGNYKTFKAFINIKKKILQLREPNASNPANIGSSSNHMFMHLFLFLGLHEHFIRERSPFIPQFLILDQLSQPYYEEAKKSGKEDIEADTDKEKLTEALKMLNDFIGLVMTELKSEFQFILLEHASKDYWESAKLEHFHLVEEFRNGNALIIKAVTKASDEDKLSGEAT